MTGIKGKPFGSVFAFWRWATTIFQVIYVIEAREAEGERAVGFTGLYNIVIGRSLWLSLWVFKPEDRRRGCGRQALGLILDYLQETRVAREMFAEVLRENISSFSFFKKLGFQVCGFHRDKLLLEKRLFVARAFNHLYEEHQEV